MTAAAAEPVSPYTDRCAQQFALGQRVTYLTWSWVHDVSSDKLKIGESYVVAKTFGVSGIGQITVQLEGKSGGWCACAFAPTAAGGAR